MEDLFERWERGQAVRKADLGRRVFYHLTSTQNVPNILRSGLRLKRKGGLTITPGGRKHGKIFLWVTREAAEEIAEWHDFPSLAILEVQVPHSYRIYLDVETGEGAAGYEDIRVVRREIPPGNIKLVGYTPGQDSGEDKKLL